MCVESNRQGCAGARERRSGHTDSSAIYWESPRGVGELGSPVSEAISTFEENRRHVRAQSVSEEMDPTHE